MADIPVNPQPGPKPTPQPTDNPKLPGQHPSTDMAHTPHLFAQEKT